MVIELLDLNMVFPPPRKDAAAWLERIGCRVKKKEDGLTVTLPDNCTVVEVQDGCFQQKSLITLPSGTQIIKAVSHPCLRPGCNHVKILAVIAEKEPEEELVTHKGGWSWNRYSAG